MAKLTIAYLIQLAAGFLASLRTKNKTKQFTSLICQKEREKEREKGVQGSAVGGGRKRELILHFYI